MRDSLDVAARGVAVLAAGVVTAYGGAVAQTTPPASARSTTAEAWVPPRTPDGHIYCFFIRNFRNELCEVCIQWGTSGWRASVEKISAEMSLHPVKKCFITRCV